MELEVVFVLDVCVREEIDRYEKELEGK